MSAEKVGEQEKGRRRRRRSSRKDEPEVSQEAAEPEMGVSQAKGRATPSRRRETQQEHGSGNLLTRFRDYIEGVQSEMQKVVWPTRQEARRLTIIVLIVLIASSIALGTISALFTELFRIGLNAPLVVFGFMALAIGVVYVIVRRNSQRSPY